MTKIEKAYQIESKKNSNFTKNDIMARHCPHDYGMKDEAKRYLFGGWGCKSLSGCERC